MDEDDDLQPMQDEVRSEQAAIARMFEEASLSSVRAEDRWPGECTIIRFE